MCLTLSVIKTQLSKTQIYTLFLSISSARTWTWCCRWKFILIKCDSSFLPLYVFPENVSNLITIRGICPSANMKVSSFCYMCKMHFQYFLMLKMHLYKYCMDATRMFGILISVTYFIYPLLHKVPLNYFLNK